MPFLSLQEWEELNQRGKLAATWFIATLIDALFLLLWAAVQASVGFVIQWLSPKLSLISVTLLAAFQILFAVATVVPIVLWLWVHYRTLRAQARRRIEEVETADE